MEKEQEGRVNPLYEERLLVLMEDIDAGVFRQVILNQTQFKKVSDAICAQVYKDDSLRKGFEMAEIETGDIEIKVDIFDGMSSIDE